jgi:hypothetical protein
VQVLAVELELDQVTYQMVIAVALVHRALMAVAVLLAMLQAHMVVMNLMVKAAAAV